MPATSLSRPARTALQILGVSLVSLILLEIALRVVDPLGLSDLHNQRVLWNKLVRFDEEPVGKRLIPGAKSKLRGWDVAVNSLGFRDDEFPRSKPPGERRLLLLGDSFVFGHGVPQDDLAAKRLEDRLARETGSPWQVINAGLGSYATHEERLLAEQYAQELEVDAMLLLYTFNDCDGRFVRLAPWHKVPDYVPPQELERARRRDALSRDTGLRARLRPLKTSFWPRLVDAVTWARKARHQALPGAAAALDTTDWGWRFSMENLRALDDLSKRLSIPWLVVYMHHGAYGGRDSYPRQVADALGEFCRSQEIAFGDLREGALEHGLDEHRNSRVDGHPNAKGQEILANLVYEELAAWGQLRDVTTTRPPSHR